MDQMIYPVIEERRAHPKDHGDLLSMLMLARDEETGETMSDRQLRDEAVTIFTAGHETTATALAWTFYLLSKHPAVERQLRGQLADVLGDKPVTLADLHRIPLLEGVVKESMRLYPPIWVFARSAIAEDDIGGTRIRPGNVLMLSSYVTHRHPALWENPEGFDPSRFSAPPAVARPRFSYFPFGGGARQCIGDSFAMMEAQLILATVLRRVKLSLAPWQRVEPEPLVTLRPRDGMTMIPSRPAPVQGLAA
jgi:cytochrome P450